MPISEMPEPREGTDADAALRAAGIPVTEAGKAANREHTPEMRAKWREQAGRPPAADRPASPSTDMRAMLRSVGINVTEEGIARARQRRLEVAAKWTPERWARLRKRLGMPEEAE